MESADLVNSTLDFILLILPIALPIILAFILFDMWVYYAREKFISEQENVLLKVVPPTDVLKTPLAMELFINGLYQVSGESDFVDVYWKGSVRPWFSLEMVSDGGKVNFYIWTTKKMAGYLESQIYAQYPGIEVIESPDYATETKFDDSRHKFWAAEFVFLQDNSIPIKTYVDYGLDKPMKDEEKTDPITPTLEFLGSIREGERVWIQIIVKAHKKEDPKPDKWFGKTDLWVDNHKKEVKKIRDAYKEKDDNKPTPVSTIQDKRIEAIERAQGKLPFDVGMRGAYLADKDVFSKGTTGGIMNAFQQYGSANLNGFKPTNKPGVDWWWQDPFGRKERAQETQLLQDYRDRAYFHRTYMGRKRNVLVMNSEELATMFHFPGSVALTPNLERVQSRKSNAPSDLPV